MKTSDQLIKEVESELNAVRAADMGLEAVEAFALDAQQKFAGADVLATKDSIDNLLFLVRALRVAVPANVNPASAGPVGKNPHEQYLEAAAATVSDSLAKMSEALGPVQDLLKQIDAASQHALQATAAIKSPDLKGA